MRPDVPRNQSYRYIPMNSRQFPKKCAVTQDSQPPRRNDTPRSNPNMNAATGLLLWAIPNNKAETSMAANHRIAFLRKLETVLQTTDTSSLQQAQLGPKVQRLLVHYQGCIPARDETRPIRPLDIEHCSLDRSEALHQSHRSSNGANADAWIIPRARERTAIGDWRQATPPTPP